MIAVILAGGFGSRLSEETIVKPKPMVEIGGKPIIWHIMQNYSLNGINEFIICCGYKGYVIKEYFNNYWIHNSDITFDLGKNKKTINRNSSEDWKVTCVDTGLNTNTAGRIKRIYNHVKDYDYFYCTYGDGLSNIDISELTKFHKRSNKLVSITAVNPPNRFGNLGLSGDVVEFFHEKMKGEDTWINGGFFVINPRAIEANITDECSWEFDCLPSLAQSGELGAYKHTGFWQPMDTLREKQNLELLWQSGNVPWLKNQ